MCDLKSMVYLFVPCIATALGAQFWNTVNFEVKLMQHHQWLTFDYFHAQLNLDPDISDIAFCEIVAINPERVSVPLS